MGSPNLVPIPNPDDKIGIVRAIKKLASIRLNADSIPTFASLILGGLTASRLMGTDNDGVLVSIDDLTEWIVGVANQISVSDNGDGTITLSTPQDIDVDADVEFDSVVLKDSSDAVIMSSDINSFYITSVIPPAEIETGNPIGLLLILTYTI